MNVLKLIEGLNRIHGFHGDIKIDDMHICDSDNAYIEICDEKTHETFVYRENELGEIVRLYRGEVT